MQARDALDPTVHLPGALGRIINAADLKEMGERARRREGG